MIHYILDTDHISFYRRGNVVVHNRISSVSKSELGVTIISFEEQMRGRLARLRRTRNQADIVRAYTQLLATLDFYAQMRILPFDDVASEHFQQLHQQRIRIGTQDLRIAAIALANNCTVVTRNRRDFERVPMLTIEDWTIPVN